MRDLIMIILVGLGLATTLTLALAADYRAWRGVRQGHPLRTGRAWRSTTR